MNIFIMVEVAALIATLCATAWLVMLRQKTALERDRAALAAMREQVLIATQSMQQMQLMNALNLERAKRESTKHQEGEDWKAGG